MRIPTFQSESKKLEKAAEEIAESYAVGELEPSDCEGCSVSYPTNLNIDNDVLYNTAKKVSAQILVYTGETNWTKDIGDEKTVWGHVCRKLDSRSSVFQEIVGGNIRINGCDLFDDDLPESQVAIIILPQFVRIVTDEARCVEDVAAVLKVKPGETLPGHASPLPERGFILLCSHGKRDKRCGVTAPLMKRALNMELRSAELYRDFDDDTPGGVRVLFVNHVGGHKYAANALVYQNDGMAIMLARLRPEHAKALVEKTILQGIVIPEFVRSCNKIAAYSW